MCLAVPGKIVEIDEKAAIRMGKIDFGGVIQDVCLEALPEAVIGDYAIVHAGLAIALMSEEEAMEALASWKEIEESLADEEQA